MRPSDRPAAQACVGRLWEGTLSGERVERRLAAILAADVAGYSRLMGRTRPALWRGFERIAAN